MSDGTKFYRMWKVGFLLRGATTIVITIAYAAMFTRVMMFDVTFYALHWAIVCALIIYGLLPFLLVCIKDDKTNQSY